MSDGPWAIVLFTREGTSDFGPEQGDRNSKEPTPEAVMSPECETANAMPGEALRM